MSITTPIETRKISRSKLTFEFDNIQKSNVFNGLIETSTLPVAGEDIAENSLVYLDSDGLIKKANYASFSAIGMVSEDLLEDDPVTIIFEGKVTITDHGFAIGEPLFLTTGSPNYSNTLPTLTSGDLIQRIGYAMDADTIYLNIEEEITME